MAVNPLSHKVYVIDSAPFALPAGDLTIIDPIAGTVNTTFDFNSSGPQAIAIDPVKNLIWVANECNNPCTGKGAITVWSGVPDDKTAFISTIPIDGLESFISIDSGRGFAYFSGVDLGAPFNTGITKIDERNLFARGPFPQVQVPQPGQFVIDEVTNTLYVTAVGETLSFEPQNQLYVIDGSTLTVKTVLNIGGPGPYRFTGNNMQIAINPATHKVYVGSDAGLTVIDGSNTNYSMTGVSLPTFPDAIAVNALTNMIYVTGVGSTGPNFVAVVDGASNTLVKTFSVTGAATGSPTGAGQIDVLALNPLTNRLYVTTGVNEQSNLVDIDLAAEQLSLSTDLNSIQPNAIAVNSVTHKIYVANAGEQGVVSSTVTVIDPTLNNLVKTIPLPSNAITPYAMAADPITNTIYVVNKDSSNISVIDGNTDLYKGTITDPAANDPLAIIVNPANDKVYVANNGSGNVTIIDGGTETILKTVAAGPVPFAFAVNNFVSHLVPGQVMHKIYVVNNLSSNGTVTEIDGDTDSVTNTIQCDSFPFAIAVNPLTNHVWVADDGTHDITMFDAESHQTIQFSDPSATHPRFVGVDPITDGATFFGKVYVVNQGTNNVTIIKDAFGHPFTNKQVGNFPSGFGVNPNTNHVYVANFGDNSFSVIDGASDSVNTFNNPLAEIAVGLDLNSIAVDPTLNQVYVNGLNTFPAPGNPAVTTINEQQFQGSPLQTGIVPLPDNVTWGNPPYAQLGFSSLLDPTFNLNPSSSFTPFAPPVDNTFFQVDSWQGQWVQASSAGAGLFSAMPSLQPGLHILYAFAADGMEANASTSSQLSGFSAGTFLGSIAAYPFVSGAAPEITGISPTSGGIGTLVSIAGHGFGGNQGTSTITFNGTDAGQAATWSETLITINVPSGATTGPVIVTVGGIASNGVIFTVKPTADLSLTKTASPGPVPSGQNITYTLTVTNNGPNDATGVTLIDTFDPSSSAQSFTASQGTCTGGTPSATCNLGTITSGSTAIVTFVVLPPPGPGSITN